MNSIFILAKVVEKDFQQIKLKEYKTNKTFIARQSVLDTKTQIDDLCLFKLIEPIRSYMKYEITEVLTLEELAEQKNLLTMEDVVLYTRALASIEKIKSHANSPLCPKWDTGNQSKANRYLKELKDKGIDISESEAEFNELLSRKKQVQLAEKQHRITELLNRLEELTDEHNWSDKAANECLKELRTFKSKEDAQPFELRLKSLEEKIMSDEVFLRKQRGQLAERMNEKILKLENGLLYGRWEKPTRKQINDAWEKVKKFKLDDKYAPKIAELDAKNELLKQGKLINPFSDEEKKAITNIEMIVGFSMMKSLIAEKQGRLPKSNCYARESMTQHIEKHREELLELKLKYPHNYEQFCLEIVKRKPQSILLLTEPTEESCLMALEHDIELFILLENKTESICLHVLEKDGMLLEHIEEQTPEMCMVALAQNPDSIAFFKM